MPQFVLPELGVGEVELFEPEDCSACEGVDCTAEPLVEDVVGIALTEGAPVDPALEELDRGLLELGVAELELFDPDDCSETDGVDCTAELWAKAVEIRRFNANTANTPDLIIDFSI
jgi:hypothetical protein